MIDIRQPNISAVDEKEQLLQMRSYLYQLAQQLNWAFSTVSGSGGGDGHAGAPAANAESAAGTNNRINPQKTFAALKDLIIKSADIVEAYYDKISAKLDGLYVAQSDFGIYTEQTASEIKANSAGIEQLFENNRTIITTVDTLESNVHSTSDAVNRISRETSGLADEVQKLYAATIETKAYIKTGMLYEDSSGIPVYGMEIGQTNDVSGDTVFCKFARFTSDRMSFYDRNETEVAYISDYKLYITNAEITGTLTLTGRFKIYYRGGLAFQWIGGGENAS